MVKVFVGFGSNLGDRFANFLQTQNRLQATAGVLQLKCSPLYLTEPLIRPNHSKSTKSNAEKNQKYLNAVLCFETTLQIRPLFQLLQDLEKQMGRTTGKGLWRPRTVDLDLLFYGDVIFLDASLQIPHPAIPARRFVLQPLCDLAPDFVHPELQLSIKKLLDLCDDPLMVWPAEQ